MRYAIRLYTTTGPVGNIKRAMLAQYAPTESMRLAEERCEHDAYAAAERLGAGESVRQLDGARVAFSCHADGVTYVWRVEGEETEPAA